MNAPLHTPSRQTRRADGRWWQKLARRSGMLLGRSGIEAGGAGRRWDGAQTILNAPQATIAASPVAGKRAAALSMNNPLAMSAVEKWASALVGPGWNARSQHPDPDTARALNDAFEAMTRDILLTLARGLVRDGEAFVQLIVTKDADLRLKPIAPEQIDANLTRDLGEGRRIIAGIEFDGDDQVIAYHVYRDPPGATFASYGAPIRIPASDILHIFDRLFPGQVRGLSWLAPVLLKLRDRDEASDALLMREKVAALMTGFIRDPEGNGAGFDGEESGSALNVALEPGAMRILPPGADVTFSGAGSGLTQSVEFLRAQDREIAAGVGLTYEALTGDLSRTNYSSARVGLLEFRRRAELLQKALIEGQFLRPLWRRWIDISALSGAIQSDPTDHHAVRFVPPGWQWVDPLKEVNADIAAIEAGLKSREEVVAARGRDVDELDAERARDTGTDQ